MVAKSERWSFIVPGEAIAIQHPTLLALLAQAGKSWEEFIYFSTAEILSYLNQPTYEAFQEGINLLIHEVTRHPQYVSHAAPIDDIVTNVIAGFDLIDADFDNDHTSTDISCEKQYAILYPAVVSVMQLIVRCIVLMFKEPRENHGTPYEISLDRVIGRDLIFTISYM